jgi:hypothetical protein
VLHHFVPGATSVLTPALTGAVKGMLTAVIAMSLDFYYSGRNICLMIAESFSSRHYAQGS